MYATKQLLNRLLICDILFFIVSVVSAIVSAFVLPETKTHIGHLIAILGAFVTLMLYVVAVTMLFLGQYWGWKVYAASFVLGAVSTLPMGYLIISSVDSVLAGAGSVVSGMIVCVAIALHRDKNVMTAESAF